MKLDKVAGSGNDEFYTPKYAILPIIKYLKLKQFKTIWTPFDTSDSLFVKLLRENGFKVVATHLETGGDFFDLITDTAMLGDVDAIVSNPPYSIKADIFEALFASGKPFAMLVGVVGLFESQRRFDMFKNNSFEIMYLNRRVAYFKDYTEQKPSKNPPFSSVYVTSQILPKQIVFEEIDKNEVK
jgi:hypothetical protein